MELSKVKEIEFLLWGIKYHNSAVLTSIRMLILFFIFQEAKQYLIDIEDSNIRWREGKQ